MLDHSKDDAASIPEDLAAFIGSARFPCVGAKSALRTHQISVHEAGSFHDHSATSTLYEPLLAFGRSLEKRKGGVQSLICTFRHCDGMTEARFEQLLWRHLQHLHALDLQHNITWADDVSDDTASPDFAFSVGGEGYFVVGLHPGASRQARRFCRPALVFNSQKQFESLRQDGRYGRMKTIIRQREIELDGSINPMLGEHGERAQAPQFSGRYVDPNWTCPFKIRSSV